MFALHCMPCLMPMNQLLLNIGTDMATKPTKAGVEEGESPIHRIRITLTSRNVKNLEKGGFLGRHATCLQCSWAAACSYASRFGLSRVLA
jgi:hypothetical protein